MIERLRVNGLEKNIAVEDTLELSWNYRETAGPFVQQSWRVRILDGLRPVADTGERRGREMSASLPAGGLPSDRRFTAELSVTADGKTFVRRAEFETALKDRADWGAQWITGEILGRRFRLGRAVESAKLFVTGLGYYHCYLNGKKVGRLHAAPTYTNYSKRIEYQVFDVTGSVGRENSLLILLGSHWEPGADDCRYYSGPRAALLRLRVRYRDGGEEVIVSDENFLRAPVSPFIRTSVYNGETFDARLAPGWFRTMTVGADWEPAEVLYGGAPAALGGESPAASLHAAELFAQRFPGVEVKRVLRPKKAWTLPATGSDGSPEADLRKRLVYDFGINISGVLRISGRAPEGARLVLRHAELLNADGSINAATSRIAEARDEYVFAGGEREDYSPYFTYHGFRYAEVEYVGADPGEIVIEALEISSNLAETGTFRCSNRQINRIHRIMKQTLSNNLYGIPTDCSQRDERQGWLGDAQVSMPAVLCLWDAKEFYRAYLDEIASGQNPDGSCRQHCAPAFVGGTTLMWTGAFYMMADLLFKTCLDAETVHRHYPALCRFYDSLRAQETERGFGFDGMRVGDWLGTYSSENHSNLAVYCDFANKLAEFSGLLGETRKEKFFRAEFDRLREKYNRLYYFTTPNKSGAYGDTNETGQYVNALSVCFGLEPEGEAEKVGRTLAFDVGCARGEPAPATGLIGTRYLFEALDRIGRNDLALELFLKKNFPSWGFMLAKGASTVWERWEYLTDNNMNSHCHAPLAAPLAWLYCSLCGIRLPIMTGEGILFEFRPYYSPKLDYAEAERITEFGTVRLRWERRNGRIVTRFTVPPNTTAVFRGRVYGAGSHTEEEAEHD